ncbi:centromere/kinetochore protein zw10 homolog [Amyelois transitella]|uniref:centromere/kinetochore protein zw10 homolog n=1 Tax=Amyelois transitella TaxID=680683 RepID=UPI00067DEE7A|nr:centromere/kinetochore protein zw10 homolog [Amyelois transitella]
MADYNVEDVLKTIFNNSSTWKPTDKIPLVIKEIEQLKVDMKAYIGSCDWDIESIINEGKELCIESKALVDEMQQCKQEIEQETMAEILKSIENHDQLSKELQLVNFAMNILYDVVQCGRYVKEFDEGREAQSYSRSIEAVYDLVQLVEMPAEGFRELDLYVNTKTTGQLILDNLLHELFNEWTELVYTNINASPKKTVITFKIKLDESQMSRDILNALERCKRLREKVTELGQFLLKEVLIPIIHNDCTVFAETDILMTITINHKPNYKPPYDHVIANLRLLFHYLSNRLNIEFDCDRTIIRKIGSEIAVAFRDILVEDCLIDTIPNNINELQSYGKITSEIEDFQHFLTVVKFFPEENLSILDYVNNIDVIFSEKSSQYFLETARSIMLKDLSATMSIGVETIPESNEVVGSPLDENTEDALKILDATIPKSLFYFPRCMISKTAQELLDLVYVMMEQAVQCSDVVCKKLYHTTRIVFELYDAVVPYYHENYLQTIPQYVALFHNNCMYLAHNLQTFGDKWMILMEGRELDYPISFVDLVQKLRDLGYHHLTVHMQQQRKQILDNVRSSDLNSIVVKDLLSNNAEAAVRQCLRQLHLLKNVWIGVFPANVFVRLMGTLVNMFVHELIHRVCTVEDISMEMAVQLGDIYTVVVQKAPGLFQNQEDVHAHVKSWAKFQELIFVLRGSLKDIEKHWNDGVGPLSEHFKTDELRTLIKALFQNTQFRANLLSKIK